MPTPYCTKQDIIDRWTIEDLLIVADRDRDGSLNAAEDAVITKAIADADAEIDGYVGAKYPLPLATPNPAEVVRMSADLAMYYLSTNAGTMSELKQQRYDNAIRLLRDISRGDAQLNVADIKTEGIGVEVVVGEGDDRLFTRTLLQGVG